MENLIFSQIMESCPEKKVVSCCKKLWKKSALTSMETASSLAELAYWLFIYGHEQEALKVCAFSHIDDPQPNKVNYNVWDFILFVWGLEAYIYCNQGDSEKCAERVAAMERVWSIPSGIFDTAEKMSAHHRQIRDRLTFEEAVNKDKIDALSVSGNKSAANRYRLHALFKMIGYGVTGSFPQLEAHREELGELIASYVRALK